MPPPTLRSRTPHQTMRALWLRLRLMAQRTLWVHRRSGAMYWRVTCGKLALASQK